MLRAVRLSGDDLVSMLDGGIRSIFGAAFGALYLSATLHRSGTEPIYNSEGVITGYSGGADISCRAQVDACTYAMRQADGYSEGDVSIIVLADGLGVSMSTDMQITVRGQRWMIASADLDAAASHWICRGRAA